VDQQDQQETLEMFLQLMERQQLVVEVVAEIVVVAQVWLYQVDLEEEVLVVMYQVLNKQAVVGLLIKVMMVEMEQALQNLQVVAVVALEEQVTMLHHVLLEMVEMDQVVHHYHPARLQVVAVVELEVVLVKERVDLEEEQMVETQDQKQQEQEGLTLVVAVVVEDLLVVVKSLEHQEQEALV
jgi:hypothetical protein